MQEENLAILVGSKGRGSNMQALVEACKSGKVPAKPYVVVSPKEKTQATEWAEAAGVRVEVVSAGETYTYELLKALEGATVVCLAGFMRLLPNEVLQKFPNRVLNIHPSLLPKFGGHGMYGMKVHEAVVEARATESGCTVHYVNERYDEGEILMQSHCPVHPDDTPAILAERVLALEHQTYPEALRRLILGQTT